MKSYIVKKIYKFLNNPYTDICIGLSVMITVFFDFSNTILEKMLGVEIKTDYGVFIFAVAYTLKSLSQIAESFQKIEKSKKIIKKIDRS